MEGARTENYQGFQKMAFRIGGTFGEYLCRFDLNHNNPPFQVLQIPIGL